MKILVWIKRPLNESGEGLRIYQRKCAKNNEDGGIRLNNV